MSGAQKKTSSQSEVCPYSFVPLKYSLTPELSARSNAALRTHSQEPLVARTPVSPYEKNGSLKTLSVFYDPNRNYAAVKTVSEKYPQMSLETVFSLDFEQHYRDRIKAGLIVGEMQFDPRFATSTMWETGDVTVDDRKRVYLRMAWVAEFGEKELIKRAPRFAQIQIADFRSRKILAEVWETIDAEIRQQLREEQSRRTPIPSDQHKGGTPPHASWLPDLHASGEQEVRIVSWWKPVLPRIILPLLLLAAAFSIYEMSRGTPKTGEAAAGNGSGSGSADASGAVAAPASAAMPGAAVGSGSAKDSGSDAGSGSGSGSGSTTGNSAADGSRSGTEGRANPQTDATAPGAAGAQSNSTTMFDACAWMLTANADKIIFKAGSCPPEETVAGCDRTQTADTCTLSLKPLPSAR